MLATVRKALVPVVVAGVLVLLAKVGIVATPDIKETVTLIVTAVLVYFIPNEPRA